MTKSEFQPQFYDSFEDMRHSEHWHYQRLDESLWQGHLSNQDWTTLHDEFSNCGMINYSLKDSFGVIWREFMIDYADWLRLRKAY